MLAMQRHNPYKFTTITTVPNLPNADKAKGIMHSLANDEGVLAVMKKHKWSVDLLCELHGYCEECLGLNYNKGARICIRLRSDDETGFRSMESIESTLCHELAHNVHSDHDAYFYELLDQIKREIVELAPNGTDRDWAASQRVQFFSSFARSSWYVPTPPSLLPSRFKISPRPQHAQAIAPVLPSSRPGMNREKRLQLVECERLRVRVVYALRRHNNFLPNVLDPCTWPETRAVIVEVIIQREVAQIGLRRLAAELDKHQSALSIGEATIAQLASQKQQLMQRVEHLDCSEEGQQLLGLIAMMNALTITKTLKTTQQVQNEILSLEAQVAQHTQCVEQLRVRIAATESAAKEAQLTARGYVNLVKEFRQALADS